jgi:hypothetical protein
MNQVHKIEFKINVWRRPCNFYSRYLGILPLDRSRAIEPRGLPWSACRSSRIAPDRQPKVIDYGTTTADRFAGMPSDSGRPCWVRETSMGDDVTKAHLLPYALETESGKTVELSVNGLGATGRIRSNKIRYRPVMQTRVRA